MLVSLSWRCLLVHLGLETAMDLDLLAALHALEDGVTRAFLWTILGAHRLRGLNSTVRAASSILIDRDRWLVAALRSGTSCCTMAYLGDSWGSHTNLRRTTDDRARCSKPLCCTHLIDALVHLLLFDDGSLITSSCIGLLRAHSAARVGTQVLDLTDVRTATLSLHVVQDYALDLLIRATLRDSGLDELLLGYIEASTACLVSERLLG